MRKAGHFFDGRTVGQGMNLGMKGTGETQEPTTICPTR